MANIINFRNAPIRVQMVQGEPWFVAKDVCDLLDLVNSRKATRSLRDSEKGVTISDTPGGKQEVTIVNESGLYSLIFQSRKPAAQDFRYWVTSDVLPSLRKYGRYVMPGSKEQQKLDSKIAKDQRKEWLEAISKQLTGVDHKVIAKQMGIDVFEITDVLYGLKADTSVELECTVRAARNTKIRKVLDNPDFRREIMDKYLS